LRIAMTKATTLMHWKLMKEWSRSQYVKSRWETASSTNFSELDTNVFGFRVVAFVLSQAGESMLRFRTDRVDATSKCPILRTQCPA